MVKRFLNLLMAGILITSLALPAAVSAQATSRKIPKGSYAALGDSVAAGLGLGTSSDGRCGRTAAAYGYEIAKAKGLTIIHQACSGATAGDLFTKQRAGSPNLPPQLDAAFASGTPELITITAGANDAHWDEFLRACYVQDCANDISTTIANAYLVALQLKLYYLFYDIQSRSGGQPPKVIMTGYYNPLSQACADTQTEVTTSEITWLRAELRALNQTIKNVSSHFSFVTYVPVHFAGHDLCSSDPWVQGLADPAPFHPTEKGQQAITKAILPRIGN